MKLLFASDSFKGTLSSEQTVSLLARAAKETFGDIEYSGVAVADGGEGATDAVIAAENGEKGYVLWQQWQAGMQLEKGTSIDLEVSRGPEPETETTTEEEPSNEATTTEDGED